jgi:hypothetical protein
MIILPFTGKIWSSIEGINMEKMDWMRRVKVFQKFSSVLLEKQTSWEQWAKQAKLHNPWFTEENVRNALLAIVHMLTKDKLEQMLAGIPITENRKKVGVIMAGNLPLVGFHDFMCILLSGNLVYAKVSAQDPVLIKILAEILLEIEPAFRERVFFVERMNDMDAVIATGSDNSAKYFNYYFSSIPHIIRKNRTSIGILNGTETKEDFIMLGKDIFMYFGLGCRNISKLYVPNDYHWIPFFEAIEVYHEAGNHHKYQNNYSYNKSVYLINSVKHFDNGFVLLTESQELVSPLGVIFYEPYADASDLKVKLSQWQDKIQVIASRASWYPQSIPFGCAQTPELWDYADGVNTLEFLATV